MPIQGKNTNIGPKYTPLTVGGYLISAVLQDRLEFKDIQRASKDPEQPFFSEMMRKIKCLTITQQVMGEGAYHLG